MATHADVVAQIQQVKQLKPLLPHHILFHIDLNALPGTLQVRKPRLPHQPVRHNPPGHTHFLAAGLQLRPLHRRIVLEQLRGALRPAKFSRKCFMPKGLDLF